MKKIWKFGAVLLCTAMVFGGCSQSQPKDTEETSAVSGAEQDSNTGQEEESSNKAILKQDPEDVLEFVYDYDPAEYLTLDGDYKAIVFSAEDLEVTEENVQSSVDALLLEHLVLEEVTDREALSGDTLDIDFTGTLDGEVIYDETNYQLELGSGVMVSGFEESLEGARAGDEITLDLKYPEDYGNDLLNGKTVHFEVTVHQVYLPVVPDYTDEFVAQYTGYDTIQAYEASLKETLEQTEKEDAVAIWLDEHSTLEDCPEDLKETYEQRMLDYYEMLAQYTYGMDLETLLKEMDYDSEEEFLEAPDNQDAIMGNIKSNMGYEYVAVKEGLKSTVGEYVAYMESYAELIGYNDAEELLEYFTEEEMRQLYMKNLVTNWILEHAAIK